ncbi:MAG TPA: 2-oxoacid ferredoxin oxidoreductase [Candidatus Riflebacteria bacterium]|jgi:2-oxoglutarate ferredoxin oxidoreductase subunit beta|nr:2-oxoacid ferredoxin oxidoreductase [Candidatus Riflebacteria bacterium]
MITRFDFVEGKNTAWCPGCGNMMLLAILKGALEELNLDPTRVVISSGIGQAAKMPQYLRINYFNGLHGRALPVATAIKAVNPELTVIAEGGDGDMYGEGGNHFLHTIRRNPDIAHIVHNNMVYGLTKGQASPTSQRGFITPVQVYGVASEPFNPLTTAISVGATFVARAFVGNQGQSRELIKAAITHKGYALVDIFDPCVSFNKINTFNWYKENTYVIDSSYDPSDKAAALKKGAEEAPYPLGIIYRQAAHKPTFEEQLAVYEKDPSPLHRRQRNTESLKKLTIS